VISFIFLPVSVLSFLIILPANNHLIDIDVALIEKKLAVAEPDKAAILAK